MNLRHQKESKEKKEWIIKLRIVFSYGLSDHLGLDFIKEEIHALLGSEFLAFPRKYNRISQSHVHKETIPFLQINF